ncbi:MAG: repressor LexA, partial [Bacteroidetes bacterium]|nr:repressor LexA [Bacteroidota bacterium]
MIEHLTYSNDTNPDGIPVLGIVSAGTPTFSEEVRLGFVAVPAHLLSSARNEVFALRVSGDSMIEDGIYDGNFLIVKS